MTKIQLNGSPNANGDFEGTAVLDQIEISCVCACGYTEKGSALLEFNFKEKRVLFLCRHCKKMNAISFGQTAVPLPRSRVMH